MYDITAGTGTGIFEKYIEVDAVTYDVEVSISEDSTVTKTYLDADKTLAEMEAAAKAELVPINNRREIMYIPKFKSGTIFKLNSKIEGIYVSSSWKTGYYRVIRIANSPFSKENFSYTFVKIRKDGMIFKSFSNGYNCKAWDEFVENGKVEVISIG